MVRQLSYFVTEAAFEHTGGRLRGEVGLGPIEVGDEFVVVHHQDDNTEEQSTLRVVVLGAGTMVISGGADVELRKDDILLGETHKRS